MELSGCRILIVEDEEDIRETLKDFFESEGCIVTTACHGKAALNELRSNEAPHLILLDLMMPVMNGEEFVSHKNAHAHWNQIPILIMSADHHAAERAEAMNVKWCILKPLSLNRLVSMAEEALSVA